MPLNSSFTEYIDLGSMSTQKTASSEVWLNCKMLIALLIEKLMLSIDFSPYEHSEKSVEGNENFIPFDFALLFERPGF